MDLIDEDESWEQSLPDGFKRIGDEDSPFLLRGGEKSRKQARQIHTNRDPDDQQRDEQSNEPITRELATWETKVWELDFPFVDTIPRDEIRRRAEKAADVGVKLRFIRSINRNATIQDDGVIGRYRGGSRTILIDAIKTGYLKHEVGRILAHEVGHAFQAGVRALNKNQGTKMTSKSYSKPKHNGRRRYPFPNECEAPSLTPFRDSGAIGSKKPNCLLMSSLHW